MLEQTTTKIGKTEYILQQLPSTRGLEVGIHLIQIAMGATDGISNISGNEDFLDAEYSPAKMASGILNKIDKKETPAFIKTLIRESLIKPEPGDNFEEWYETHFSANYIELADLIAAIIDHNGYMDLIKKKTEAVMGIFSSVDEKAQG